MGSWGGRRCASGERRRGRRRPGVALRAMRSVPLDVRLRRCECPKSRCPLEAPGFPFFQCFTDLFHMSHKNWQRQPFLSPTKGHSHSQCEGQRASSDNMWRCRSRSPTASSQQTLVPHKFLKHPQMPPEIHFGLAQLHVSSCGTA